MPPGESQVPRAPTAVPGLQLPTAPSPAPTSARASVLPRCALGHVALALRWAAQWGGPQLTQRCPAASSSWSVLFAENLAKVFSLMDPNSPERVAFVSRALKWSSGGSGKLGHPRLHQLLALTLWKEQNYCESRYHFLHSADGEGCANMLVEYSTSRGFRSEVDMFVAQAVLQFLCLKNKSSASVVFTTYTQKHPSIEDGPPFVEPLLNFIWFLLLAVDGGKLTVFTVLCEQYQPSLRRDPMYNEYLDRIGQLFFGIPPKQTSSYGGLLGNLLSSLMGSSEQEEGEESPSDGSPIELD
ncbi:GET4 isoform 5 [Pongo abelii]|uniref:GET4 isoform 5 n=1 Tax=Pongo abelii TaxID=9601 RepID=A0A2J8SR81_PONAB|nr:GET4 isoform 5 [Pongo abelii]